MAILAGNASLQLGTPATPSLSASGSGATLPAATYSVIVVALTLEGYQNSTLAAGVATTKTINGADGKTFVLSGGSSNKSTNATQAVTLGQTLFADDLYMPRMLWCRLLRSSIPFGRIRSIDTSRAKDLPGVKLVLTGEEILDSGVQVVAHPPGKRNTTIHQLSGGEKALTAISLVFALFQLNPAPFCLLDEVDAPLDESNTHRFCSMVQNMSAESQFLFISHNKITMEMANQLVGITMPDPGISRVVAVDIAEALELASDTALAT
jgi:hypothetical protein